MAPKVAPMQTRRARALDAAFPTEMPSLLRVLLEEGVLAGKRVKRTEGDTYFKCDGLSNDDACTIAHYLQHLEQSARDPISQRLLEATTPLTMFEIMINMRIDGVMH